ncbi:unnamed protein product [Protopolystoma xenopodis]|uniref:Uncharacterized protein n=1 Tax=Protopolystoma xenopodis TaxID=117903 RepID=A0A3S5A6E2_9PLAT|nr:unnamed protein product [Protopolystoma xenopodis]
MSDTKQPCHLVTQCSSKMEFLDLMDGRDCSPAQCAVPFFTGQRLGRCMRMTRQPMLPPSDSNDQLSLLYLFCCLAQLRPNTALEDETTYRQFGDHLKNRQRIGSIQLASRRSDASGSARRDGIKCGACQPWRCPREAETLETFPRNQTVLGSERSLRWRSWLSEIQANVQWCLGRRNRVSSAKNGRREITWTPQACSPGLRSSPHSVICP